MFLSSILESAVSSFRMSFFFTTFIAQSCLVFFISARTTLLNKKNCCSLNWYFYLSVTSPAQQSLQRKVLNAQSILSFSRAHFTCRQGLDSHLFLLLQAEHNICKLGSVHPARKVGCTLEKMWSLSLEVNIFSPRDSPHEHSGGNSSSCTGNLVLRVPITRNHRAHSMSAFCRSSIWSCGQFHIRHSTYPFPPPQITWRDCNNSLIWKKFSRAARTGNDDLLVARVVDGHSTVFTGQALCRIIYRHGAGSKAANYLFPKTPYELPVHSTVDKLFEGLKKKLSPPCRVITNLCNKSVTKHWIHFLNVSVKTAWQGVLLLRHL